MSKHHSIVLPENPAEYRIDENQITLRRDRVTTHYRLPRGRPVISVHRFADNRGQLNIGGFSSLTVTVVGPLEIVNQLRDAVL